MDGGPVFEGLGLDIDFKQTWNQVIRPSLTASAQEFASTALTQTIAQPGVQERMIETSKTGVKGTLNAAVDWAYANPGKVAVAAAATASVIGFFVIRKFFK